MENLPPDFWATSGSYTPHIHRDQYPAIDPRSPALSQSGKVVIITGASAGIGSRGYAPAFAKAKPKALILVARDTKKLSVTEKLVIDAVGEGNVEVVCFGADVSNPADVDRLYDMMKSKFGHADVLVNNAGVMSTSGIAPIGDVQDVDAWWRDYEVNVRGTFLMTRGFLKLLGHERKGTVISMISAITASASPAMSAYGGSKLAVARISENVAVEYPNVTSMCLQPGVVKTDAVIGKLALSTSHKGIAC
jgi:NAD(P)-dependent dehydrogenase (short-subunit alcohol dehydrogenase family)